MANFIGMSNDKTAKVNKRCEFDLQAKIIFGADDDLLILILMIIQVRERGDHSLQLVQRNNREHERKRRHEKDCEGFMSSIVLLYNCNILAL